MSKDISTDPCITLKDNRKGLREGPCNRDNIQSGTGKQEGENFRFEGGEMQDLYQRLHCRCEQIQEKEKDRKYGEDHIRIPEGEEDEQVH